MEARVYDAIVIGGGPGGYTAAIRLAQLGKSVLCVEREDLGGVCLNWGCIPSKALISAAGLVERIREADVMGIQAGEPVVDFARTQEWKAGIVARLTGSVGTLIRGNGGEVAYGAARVAGPRLVEVRAADGTTGRCEAREAVVVATGARLASLPGFEPDGERVITAREAVSLTRVPRSLVVIGGGVIGMELGMMYQKLGTRVTVVEVTEGLLPGVDPDLTRVVERRFRRRGGEALTGARALGWEPRGDGAAVTVEHGGETRVLEGERVLVSVGFRPNAGGLGLEEAGVRLDPRGHVAVDERMRTSVPWIYAVGDVAGGPYLAHKAFREAEIAAEVIAGRTVKRDWYALPAAIFTDPEIATVGMTEAQARAEGREVRVGRFPFTASGRAMSLRETDGFVKVVADGERLLGVGIVGPEASELVGEAALALEMVAAAEDVALTIHPHPTLSEGVMEAFKHALGEAVHVMNRRPARREAPALVGV
ncbi:MAG TPA: dihydrolipoyl dehydrogenase [Longimicrobiaceae bacterium]|nr:dihydrolipoyl dehydrogenase [Longimicrobiaceae bacterium]